MRLEVAGEQPVQLLLSLGAPLGLGSADTELDAASQVLGLDKVGVLISSKSIEDSSDETTSVVSIGLHVAHDHLDGDIGGAVPAVVVGRHADHLIGDLGLAGQLGLGQNGHVDHAAAPGTVHVALSAGGELWTLCIMVSWTTRMHNSSIGLHTHADNGAPIVQDNTVALQAVTALADNLGDTLIEGVTKGNVGDNTTLEVGPRPNTLGAVNDLVGDNKVTRLNLLLKTADGGEGDDAANTDRAQSGDVGTSRDLVGCDLVVGAVAAQERDGNGLVIVLTLVVQDGDGGGGFTPGSRDRQGSNLGEAR
jgi:hypothetical protein